MRWWLYGAWAVAVLVIYEIRFPLPFREAFEGIDAGFANAVPLLSPRGFLAGSLAWLKTAGALAGFAAVSAAAWGAGREVAAWSLPARVVRAPAAAPLVSLTAWMLGVAACGLALLGLGLAGLFDRVTLGLMTLSGLAVAWRPVRAAAGSWPRRLAAGMRLPGTPAAGPGEPAGRLGAAARATGILCLAATGLVLLAPQTTMDALVYHLALPDRCVRMHRLVPMPANFFFDLPVLIEMLRGWSMAIGGEPAARLWSVVGLAAGAAAAYVAVRPLAGASWAWGAFGLLASSPLCAEVARLDKPDGFLPALALLAAAWVVRRGAGAGAHVTAGALAGAAAAAKLIAAGLLPVLAAVSLLNARRRIPVGRALLALAAGAALVFGPWAARAWLRHADPVFPFGRSGTGMATPAVSAYLEYSRRVALEGRYDTLFEKLRSPWTATMTDALPPVWLALAPLVLLGLAPGLPGRLLAAAGVLGWLVWILGPPQLRFGLPALAWLAVAGVAGLAALHGRASAAGRADGGRLIKGLLAVALALQGLRTVIDTAGSGALLAGAGVESRAGYFNRVMGTYAEMVDHVRRRLPSDARVLMVGERRTYPAYRPVVAASMHEPIPAYPLIRASSTPAELKRRFRQLAVTHVVHNHVASLFYRNHQTVFPWTARDLAVWSDFWRLHVRLSVLPERLDLENGGYYLYRFDRPRAEPLATPTLPGIEGAFSSVEGYLRRGDRQEGTRLIRNLERLTGDFAQVKHFIGTVWYGGDAYRSTEYLKDADAEGLRELSLWEDLARLAEARWQMEEALMYYEKIARFEPRAVHPNHKTALQRLAHKARTRRRPEEAEAYLRRAIALEPGDGALWAELAEILLWLKRKPEAVAAMERAIRLNPRHKGYRGTLAHLRRAS